MNTPPPRRRLQFSLLTLLLLLTFVAIGILPAVRVLRHWQEVRRSEAAGASHSRVLQWLQEHRAENDSWRLSPAAGQSQESDLPGTP